ncbi:MAG: hypothetical protein WAX66_03480, partial [Patescibacteria group bacterium]
MRKSSFLPLALIISIFLVLPVAFWFFNSKVDEGIVRGAKTKSDSKGVIVKVSSGYGTWEMSKYLCKTKEECLFSTSSGKSLDKIGGGVVESQDVAILHDPSWKDYSFLKIFIKPAWGSQAGQFTASLIQSSSRDQISIESISSSDYEYSVV